MDVSTKMKVANTFDREAIHWARDVELPRERILKGLNPRACRRGTVKSVLLALAFRCARTEDGRHVTWTGARRLARDVGFDRVTILAAIDTLGKLGLLTREGSKEHDTDNIFLNVGVKTGCTLQPLAQLHNATTAGCTLQLPPGCITPSEEKNTTNVVSSSSFEEPIEGGETPTLSTAKKKQDQPEGKTVSGKKEDCAPPVAEKVVLIQLLALANGYELPDDPKLHPKYAAIYDAAGKGGQEPHDVLSLMFGHWEEFKPFAVKQGCWWWLKSPDVPPLVEDLAKDGCRAIHAARAFHEKHAAAIAATANQEATAKVAEAAHKAAADAEAVRQAEIQTMLAANEQYVWLRSVLSEAKEYGEPKEGVASGLPYYSEDLWKLLVPSGTYQHYPDAPLQGPDETKAIWCYKITLRDVPPLLHDIENAVAQQYDAQQSEAA